MLPASCTAGGMCLGFPDVCLTPAPPAPPVPIPYPNMAQCSAAKSGTCSKKVKISNMAAIVVNTEIPMSHGDEAGVNGGVISGVNMGPAKYKKGSSKVKAEGKAVCHLTSMVGQNGSNPNVPAGMQIAPSQVKVLVFP